MSVMTLPANLDHLTADELRELVRQQAEVIMRNDRELNWRQAKIDKLTHEVAYYKRHYFGVKAERLPVEQGQLFEETLAADMAAITEELEQVSEPKPKGQATRKPLPPELPRTEIHHEPESTTCACGCQLKRIGEEVAEKLDYTPGTFTVERHIRGKWACAQCETLIQAPVPAHVIDKGIPTTGLIAHVLLAHVLIAHVLIAHVLIANYLDHLPLSRQEGIFGRAGLPIPQSTLAEWVGRMGVTLQPLIDALKTDMLTYPVLHADETPVAMLEPGAGKTHRAYLWSYSIGAFEPVKAVIYDFADSPLRQNSCRPNRISTMGGDKGWKWQGTDRNSRIER